MTADVVTSMRRMCRRLGWEYPGADDVQQDGAEFYSFLHGAREREREGQREGGSTRALEAEE